MYMLKIIHLQEHGNVLVKFEKNKGIYKNYLNQVGDIKNTNLTSGIDALQVEYGADRKILKLVKE